MNFTEETLFQRIQPYRFCLADYNIRRAQEYFPTAFYELHEGTIKRLNVAHGETPFPLYPEVIYPYLDSHLKALMDAQKIKSYIILYYSNYSTNDQYRVTSGKIWFRVLVMDYNFGKSITGFSGYTIEAYEENPHNGFDCFSEHENDYIFNSHAEEYNKIHNEVLYVTPEVIRNDVGLIIQPNEFSGWNNTWACLLGKDYLLGENPDRTTEGLTLIRKWFSHSIQLPSSFDNKVVQVHETNWGDVYLKTLAIGGIPKTIFPIIKGKHIYFINNRSYCLWGHVQHHQASVVGKIGDEIFISYLATDYAENKARYESEVKQEICLSAFLYYIEDNSDDNFSPGIIYRDQYAGEYPYLDSEEMAVYNFKGTVKQVRETNSLKEAGKKAWILTIELMYLESLNTHLIIDSLVIEDNMRLSTLVPGMKIQGAFQLQACLAV